MTIPGLRRVSGGVRRVVRSTRGKRIAVVACVAFMSAMPVGAQEASPSASTGATQALQKRCAAPGWPEASLRAGESGSVLLKLLVDVDGAVIDAKVQTSSGYPRLDDAALAGLRKCRFTPGRDADGKPAQAWGTIRYTFKRDSDGRQNPLWATIRLKGLHQYIERATALCKERNPTDAQALEEARLGWHTRNDAILAEVDELEGRQQGLITGEPVDEMKARRVTFVQAGVDDFVAQNIVYLTATSAAGQTVWCTDYLSMVSDGRRDAPRVASDAVAHIRAQLNEIGTR
ncbi:MAG: energy transducer TonB [Solimonas sp.]